MSKVLTYRGMDDNYDGGMTVGLLKKGGAGQNLNRYSFSIRRFTFIHTQS